MSYMGDLTATQISEDARQQLNKWRRQHDNVVFIDTDGCVLDNMWAKQVGVFHPLFLDMFALRSIEPFFRIHAEHHNLWGKTRGEDRFLAVQDSINSILTDPQARKTSPESHIKKIKKSIDGYIQWINNNETQKLGVPSLTRYHKLNGTDYMITILLAWAESVNRTFEYTTIKMPPFKYVRETLVTISKEADILVISSTPYSDLKLWWENTDLKQYLTTIGSKEMGSKVELIRLVMEVGKYDPDHAIMIGDGGKDKTAALDNKVLFLGTPPGKEEQTWNESAENVFKLVFKGTYKGSAYQEANMEAFDNALKQKGPWQIPGYDYKKEYLKLQDQRIATYIELGLSLDYLYIIK